MGFNAKNIIKSCVNYPFVLCFLLISFLVYTFLPDYLNLWIYSSPVIVFVTVVHRVFVSIRCKRLKSTKGEEKSNKEEPKFVENENKNERELSVDTNSRSSNQTNTTRRRNVIEKNKEEEKSTGFSSKFNDNLVDKSALDEEIPNEIREVKVDSENKNVAESSSSLKLRAEMERGSSDDTDEEDEEGQRDRDNAVEWTEDDEKNVMDLGLSEIERNRRLESLIARRRSRRLLSLQARRTQTKLLGMDPAAHVASILVPRNNPFLANSSDSQTSPTPGSAPSVLLPMRNPFDLPYDPQEEKPNLTGDEFHQEFMAAHQKDMMFCRHESFVRGPFDRPDNNRGRNALDRIHTKHEDFGSGSSPKTFKAKRDSILKSPKLAAWKRMVAERRDNGRMNEFLFDSGPSVFGRITMRERRYHLENGPQHTPTNSLASDMQVEVSESSSPPLTVDGDEESSSLNDRDMEKKIGSGIEEMWGESSHLTDVDKNESSSREIHEVSEFDIMQVGFSRIKQHKSEPVSAHLSPVKEVDQGPFDSNKFPHSKIELMDKSVAGPSDSGDYEKAEIQDRVVEQRNGEVSSAVLPELLARQISTTSSSSVSPNSVLQNKGKTTDQASSSTLAQDINVRSHQSSGFLQNNSPDKLPSEKITPAAPHNTPVLAQDFQNVQEFSNPIEKEIKETNSTYSGNESEILTNSDVQILKTTKNLDGEDEIQIKQETEREQSKPSDENDSKSIDYIAAQLDNPAEEIVENSTLELSENRVEERGIEEGESSVNSQSVNESIEQPSTTTSSVISPKSVLNPKFSTTSLSSLGQDNVDEQHPHIEILENNSTVEISPDNSPPVAPGNGLHSTADSTAHPSNDTDSEKVQEMVNPSIISQEEEKGEEKLKNIEGDSQILSSLEATAELLKPYEERDSVASSKPAEPSENSVSQLAKEDSAASSKPAEPSENSVAQLDKKERSVEGETNTSSKANESLVADNTESKGSSSQSIEESGVQIRAQANLTRQWWLTID